MLMRNVAAGVVIALVVVAAVTYYALNQSAQPQCDPVAPGTIVRSHVTSITFGGVTEYRLPSQGRWPNAITVAPDGSVWFAEEEIPGVAHLYPDNGTLVEYAWPGYPTPQPPDCLYAASSSGIALWDGRVWAADEYANAILGVNPAVGSTVRVNTTSEAQFPYWLAVGPDGNLWFTSDNTPAAIGRIFPNLTLSVTRLEGVGADEPLQLTFVNSSLAFVAAINLSENVTTKACVCTGHIYSFDPADVSTRMAVSVVGGNYTLLLPTSVSYSDGRIWVAQHGPSSVVSYDFATRQWTKYPTSTVPWSTSLPLLVAANGSRVWFNEHYANKIAVLDSRAGTLTEISESNPPATGPSGIQNDEAIALGGGGIWFTSETANYVGFISAAYEPLFSASVVGNNSATIPPGGGATFVIRVAGDWSSPLGVNVSDSETYGSTPRLIHLEPGSSTIPAGNSPYSLTVTVKVDESLAPGRYVAAVTLTEGGVQQSAYLFIDVEPGQIHP
jgi:streptogramin lyase